MKLGINPYPYNYDFDKTYTKEISDNFDNIDEAEIFSRKDNVS